MFENSPRSKELFEYAERKFGSSIAIIFLLKCCVVVSSKLDWPRFSLMHVAPTRALKSFTSKDVMSIFHSDFWIDLKSDFTMNSLKNYINEFKRGVCLFVNDATTLLASKARRTKDRLVGGLSELLSDASYIYQDFRQKFLLNGQATVIMNITSEAFQNYKDRLFNLTFSERFLTVHHVLTKKEKEEWIIREEDAKKIEYGKIINVKDIALKVEIPRKYLLIVKHLAKEFSYLSLNSQVGCQDIIKAVLRAHASLNKRSQVCMDDVRFVLRIKPYLVNPFSPFEGLIVKYRAKGLSISQIEQKIGKSNYRQQIQRVIKKAELRGILESQSLPKGYDNNPLKRQVTTHG